MITFKNLVLVLIGGLTFSSCIEHVVIPPPLPMVVLDGTFIADTNGTQISYMKGVNGFDVITSNYREILTPPQQSNIKYFSSIQSTNLVEYFKVSIGRDFWNATNGTFPAVGQFRLYFESMTAVPFSDNAEAGVVLEWRDANNQIWKSKETGPFQTFNFLEVKQESDETGDYVKFKASFSATLYSPDETQTRTLNNGMFIGYFKNN